MSTFGMNDDDELWCNDVPYFDGGGGNGDLDQWEYLLRTFDTLPEETAARQETTEISPAARMILNSAAAAAHECEVALKKSNSSPQTVVEPMDDILDGFTHQTPNAVFAVKDSSSRRRSVLWDGRSTDKARDTTEVHSKDTAFRPLGRTGQQQQQQHVLTSDWIALRNVESRPPPPPTTPVPNASFCGMHSLYSAPTLDPVATLGNSLFPDALHYVFTPRIAEMLQSNDWSSSSSASLLTSSSANSTLLESNQSPKSMSQSGPVKAMLAHKAFPKQRSHQRPPCQPRRPTVCLPLTAYNYFYRHERDTIVQGMAHANDPLPPSVWDFTPEKKAELLHQHWYERTRLVRRLFSESLTHKFSLSFHWIVGTWIHSRKSASIEKRTESSSLQRTYERRNAQHWPCLQETLHLTSCHFIVVALFVCRRAQSVQGDCPSMEALAATRKGLLSRGRSSGPRKL
jgi:hypothetical protein